VSISKKNLEGGVTFASKHINKKNRELNLRTCGRNDEKFVAKNGKRKAFHIGGNSSCRAHLRQHYNLYKERCEKADIPLNHWAIPRTVWKKMEEEKAEEVRGRLTKKAQQQQLDFKAVTGPREFT
jgi:DNA-binding LacI/PurR family transcriptional regulator